MNFTEPERRRVKITVDQGPGKLECLAASHPFTHQVDIIFPSSDVLQSALSKLQTQYYRAKVRLSEVVEDALANDLVSPEKCFTMLSVDPQGASDDVWCIAPRSEMTLSVAKDTYERLGLVGQKLPFKGRGKGDQYVIPVPLHKGVLSTTQKKRRDDMLKNWDERRGEPWEVVYASSDGSSLPNLDAEQKIIRCEPAILQSVQIPTPSLNPRPSASEDDADIWIDDMTALFEWVGMAGLHSQRLKSYDRVDPYLALYECPSPSYIGDIVHLQWKGLIHPTFVQSLINTVLKTLKAQKPPSDPMQKAFVSITSHGMTTSPVSYIHQSTANSTSTGSVRLPRADGESTWCLIMHESDSEENVQWAMVDSVGQFDTRWG